MRVGPLAPWMRQRLRRLMRAHRGDAAIPLRARIVHLLANDPCVSTTADRLAIDRKTVRLWRDRFLAHGITGLSDRPRPGRERRIDEAARCELIAMACSRPKLYGIAFRHTWTLDTLLAAFRDRRPDVVIGRTSVGRILRDRDMRPHRMKVWMHSQDPDFRRKATEICQLYTNPPAGAVVLCVDEKTGMQALSRKHPSSFAGCGRTGRREFEYKRNGTVTLFAAFNPQTGHVFAQVRNKRKARDLLVFMRALARHYKRGTIHIVWDNLNIHYDGRDRRWTKFNEAQGGRFVFHYTPLHASWVNQVELFFSALQRRVLRYGSFDSTASLTDEVMGYIAHHNAHERKPYRWTFAGYPLQQTASAA